MRQLQRGMVRYLVDPVPGVGRAQHHAAVFARIAVLDDDGSGGAAGLDGSVERHDMAVSGGRHGVRIVTRRIQHKGLPSGVHHHFILIAPVRVQHAQHASAVQKNRIAGFLNSVFRVGSPGQGTKAGAQAQNAAVVDLHVIIVQPLPFVMAHHQVAILRHAQFPGQQKSVYHLEGTRVNLQGSQARIPHRLGKDARLHQADVAGIMAQARIIHVDVLPKAHIAAINPVLRPHRQEKGGGGIAPRAGFRGHEGSLILPHDAGQGDVMDVLHGIKMQYRALHTIQA